MPIQVICPGCQASYRLKDDLLGATVRCKQCERKFVVEAEEDIPEVTAAEGAMYAEEVRPVKRVARREEADDAPEPARRARYERDDEKRSRPRRNRQKGMGVALLLMLAFGSVAALVLLCFGVYFAVVSIKDADKDKIVVPSVPAPERQQAVLLQPVQPAPQEPDGPPDPPPADLIPAALLPSPAVALDPPQPPAAAPAAALAPGSGGSLRGDVAKRVTKATVFIRTTLQSGLQPTGSGFFAFDAHTVVTNAHVVDMMHPSSKPPRKVEVVLNSGEPDEKTYTAQIAGVDRFSDLAILRVSVKEPVEPLTVISAQGLELTQSVFVSGFPYGEAVGKEVTVVPTQVSSLRRENGVLHRVQVNGGMNPGNSGGPVVDAHGRVIGVSVAVMRNNIGAVTNINFAVPGDSVYALFQGRIRDLQLGQPYRDNQNVKVPVTLRLLDPLKHIGKIAVECWIGDPSPNPGQMRPSTAAKPAAVAGDGERRSVELTIDKDTARGELTLPPGGQDKKVLWVQPVHTSKSGTTSWSSAVPLAIVPPVEHKPVSLAFKASSQPMLTDFHMKTNHRTHAMGDSFQDFHRAAQVIEKLTGVDAEGVSTIHLEYKRLIIGGAMNRQAMHRSQGQKHIVANPGELAADLHFDRQGNVVKNLVDSTKVPAPYKQDADNEANDLQNVLASLCVTLPAGSLSPGQTWKGERRLFGSQTNHPLDNFSYEIDYTYQGVRSREGHDEAVVLLGGKMIAKDQLSVSGRVSGAVLIDVQTSQITFGRAVLDYDYETAMATLGPAFGPNLSHTHVLTEYQLKRAPANK
jgi:predicted Zn finger-like uncharacterized protein